MPIYEYRCQKCGEIFEKIQKVNEGAESIACPYCGEWEPEKLLSPFSSSKGPRSSGSTSSCGSSGSTRFS
ncbi:MAG: zinc ribbon domain-containing protein [Deltaproteobacteria bacterium]|nr:zinc ribbon domain-containing protein [Deltaproteobacteria bacterium]